MKTHTHRTEIQSGICKYFQEHNYIRHAYIVIEANCWLWSTHRTSVIMHYCIYLENAAAMCVCGGLKSFSFILMWHSAHPKCSYHTIHEQIGLYTHMVCSSKGIISLGIMPTNQNDTIASAVTHSAHEQAVYILTYILYKLAVGLHDD